MVLPTVWFALGIVLGGQTPEVVVPVLLAATVGVAVLAWLVAATRRWTLPVTLLLLGWATHAVATVPIAPHDLRNLVGGRTNAVTVRGTAIGLPELRLTETDRGEAIRSQFQVRVTSLKAGPAPWQPAAGDVWTVTDGVLGLEFFPGRLVEVSGVLSVPPTAVFSGGFDYRQHLAARGMHHQLRVYSTNDWRRLDRDRSPPWTTRFQSWARGALAHDLPVEDQPLRLQWAMLLGWKTALTDRVAEPFMRAGTMHIFAISGLHVALAAQLLVGMFRLLGITRRGSGGWVIALLWFYAAATGWQASATRSTVMMSVVITGWILARPGQLLNSLAVAAALILLFDPTQLFQPGFQLSFLVVMSLALLEERLRSGIEQVGVPEPLIPEQARPWWWPGWQWARSWLIRGVATSGAAWLGSLPLTAHYFHLITPVGLVANLVIVPLSTLSLASGLGSLATAAWAPWLAGLFNHSGWLGMLLMMQLSAWFARWPGASFNVGPPGWLGFLAWYALLLGAFGGGLWRGPRRWTWRVVLGGLAMAWVLVAWQGERVSRMIICPAGGGGIVFFDGGERGDRWLFDTGNEKAVERVTARLLQAEGVNRLDHLVLTHGSLRQVAGAPLMADRFRIGTVHVPPVSLPSVAYREAVDRLVLRGLPVVSAARGLGPWRVLHPFEGDAVQRADDAALAVCRDVGGTRILLLSGLGLAGQRELLRRHPGLQAGIVVTGLPERDEPVGTGFLRAVGAQRLIVIDDDYPANRRARAGLRDRLRRTGIEIWYTRDSGAITLTFHPGDCRLEPARR